MLRKRSHSPFATPHSHSDFALSAHYACTHCGISFEPPSPQLFSFNSPQGMCQQCDGLGEIYSFDPEQLVPESGFVVRSGGDRIGRPVAKHGALAAAHLSGGRRHHRAQARHYARHDAGNAVAQSRSANCSKLWLYGTGEGTHHVHLARRSAGNEIRRALRRHHSATAVALSHHQQQNAAAAVGKVHARDALRGLRQAPD